MPVGKVPFYELLFFTSFATNGLAQISILEEIIAIINFNCVILK